MALVINTDGGCEPVNPGGVATFGFIVRQDDRVVKRDCGVAAEGSGASNNVAEYYGLIRALEYVHESGQTGEKLLIRSDSELIVRQITGVYRVRATRILPLYHKVMELLRDLDWNIEHVPREENKEADALAGRAYKLHTKAVEISISGEVALHRERLLELGLVLDIEINIWHGKVTEKELEELRKLEGLVVIVESGEGEDMEPGEEG